MNSLNSWLPTQWIPLAILLLVVGVVLVVVSMYAWRAISRPHVRGLVQGGRQSRLGVVDKYDVGVRQLVLVRRDNVEHLIMIGGPNDLLIESTILRARTAGQAARPAGAAVPPPTAAPERVSSYPPAPRQVEEDFARPAAVEVPSVARIETAAPTPAPTTTAVPVTAPTPVPPLAVATPVPTSRSGVIPPREPGFFQRASTRFQSFKNAPGAVPPPTASKPEREEEEEPRANIDTAHFEELLGASEEETTAATTTPVSEFNFEGTDIEPAPEEVEPVTTPQPTTTRLTLPEIRLPDLKLPQWRRPEPAATTEAPVAPAPRVAEGRVEPRFTPEPRPLGGGRVEPNVTPPEPRVQATEAPARQEPFRVGERLTTPTRPLTSPPLPTTTQAPVEPEDPFASLEEEMANLLGRTKDDGRKP
ncbi:hypothetical protein ACMDCR_14400 [Labrys okinawensis]|uniref:hypothetical protein n=1 Tax=Labrys okinawensis TaxID=346911 RepID=UPI0039BD542A